MASRPDTTTTTTTGRPPAYPRADRTRKTRRPADERSPDGSERVPAEITGRRRLNYWATTAIYDQGHGWVQLQRAGGPNGTTLWNFPEGSAGININATVPSQDLAGKPAHPNTDPATGVWGQIRDQTAVVVKAGGTYSQGIHGRPTALAYGAYVADVFLPMVIPFVPGTNALWDPGRAATTARA